MEEAGREIHAGWRWDLGNGKSTYPEMPITMAGGLVPWLMRHQLRWVVRRSRSSSCNCSNIGNPRRRNKCIVGRAIADDDFQNSKLKKGEILPASCQIWKPYFRPSAISENMYFRNPRVSSSFPKCWRWSIASQFSSGGIIQQPRASSNLNIWWDSRYTTIHSQVRSYEPPTSSKTICSNYLHSSILCYGTGDFYLNS